MLGRRLMVAKRPPTPRLPLVPAASSAAPVNSSGASSGSNGASTSVNALHPDLFPPQFGESDVMVNLLTSALGSTVKSKKKFDDVPSFIELLSKGRAHAMEQDGIELPADSHTAAWTRYEQHLWKLMTSMGVEATDWYHRQLFAAISQGQHDLTSRDGGYDPALMRELDSRYGRLKLDVLKSSKASSAGSFRAKGGKTTRSSSGGGSSGSSKSTSSSGKPFTGEPCKHHGAGARHTTADCKNPPTK